MIGARHASLWRNKDRLGAVCSLVLCLFYLRWALLVPVDNLAESVGITARTWPLLLAFAGIVFSTLLFLFPSREQTSENPDDSGRSFHWKPAIALIILMLLYVFIFDWLGFFLASCVFLQSGIFLLGERRWMPILSVSIGLSGFLWVLLTQIFGVYLDNGELIRFISERVS